MYFGNPAGFYALIGVLALVIIYLIRPRPKDITIPSLMFLMKETGLAKKKSFFERLLRNLIFLLQLIAIAGLGFSMMQPSMKTTYDATAENTVIILDISASMQAGSRFNDAISTAKDSLRGDVSIILAEERPFMALDKGGRGKAKSVLDSIRPKDVGTNIGDAMLLAKDILDGQEGRVLVVSDFIQTEGPDPNVVKKILEADKAVVDFVNVAEGEDKGNLAITDMAVEKHNTVVYVKNYGKTERAATLRVVNNGAELKKVSKTILADSIETFNFETPAGVTEVEILDKDDLAIDNKAYISAPDKIEISVLLVTNSMNQYLKYALESSKDIKLTKAEPPILPDTGDFDVVIFSNFDRNKILTGTLEEIKKNAEKGRHFIVLAQDDLQQVDFLGMLPVYLTGLVNKENLKIYPFAEANDKKYGFAEDESVDYGTALKYFTATAKNESVVYAIGGENPIIASLKIGAGSALYYGIFDESASFKSSPSYPVFWNDMINSMMGTDDITRFNYKTGKLISAGSDVDVKTPSGIVRARAIIMDKAGVYDVGGVKIAANLLNEEESDIYAETGIKTVKNEAYSAGKVKRDRETNLEMYLLIIVLLSLLAEIAYVKYRGDL